jgi:hypothetical protein
VTTAAQTPGTWLKGGAGGLWSAACRAALIACGIDPDNFGDYDARAKAQAAERKKYRDQRMAEAKKKGKNKRPHEPSCPTGSDPKKMCQCVETEAALKEMGAERWNLANSQSGHISQNAFYQGHRADPCSNIPPTSGNAGTYGYEDNKAFCMDHQGRANNPGTMHYEITNREAAFAQETAASGKTTVNQAHIEKGVDGTAQIATEGAQSRQKGNGPAWDKDGTVSKERQEQGQLSDKAKDQQAKELAKKENKGKKAKGSGRGKGKKANRPSQKGPSKKDAKKARECIKDAWKQSLNEMRDNVVNEHSTAAKSAECKKEIADHNKNRKKGQPEAKSYTDLPAARRKKVDAAVAKKVDARQKELEKNGAHNAGKTGPPPSEAECLEYQANWLYNNRRANGTYPPLQGRVPDSGNSSGKPAPKVKKKSAASF